MKKKYVLISLLLVGCLLLSACQSDQRNEPDEEVTSETNNLGNGPLRVYLIGMPYYLTHKNGEEEIGYTSTIISGLEKTYWLTECAGGNALYQALLDFEKESKVRLDVVFFDDSRTMADQLEEDMENGTMPDLVIDTKTSGIDWQTMLQREEFIDLVPYMDLDSEKYYDVVLQSGRDGEQQLIVPFLFNINGYITSEEYINRVGLLAPEENETYESAMYLLQTACVAMTSDNQIEALYEATQAPNSDYIPAILAAAAGYNGLSEGRSLSRESIEEIYETMACFFQQEFVNNYGYETKSLEENLISGNTKTERVAYCPFITQDPVEKPSHIGIQLDGGYGGAMFFSNYIMQAYTMQSYYQDQGMTPVVAAIPMAGTTDQYSANVTGLGFCPTGSQNAEAAAAALQYLLDYPFRFEMGISVNRELTETYVDSLTNTSMQFQIMSLYDPEANEELRKQQIESESIWFNPMGKETADSIKFILNHIGGASLPYREVTDILRQNINAYFNETMTYEESIDEICEVVEKHWGTFKK